MSPEADSRVGLVLGFEPFAGLPTNPAELVLPALDGTVIHGATVAAQRIPVSLARLPGVLETAIAERRPAFVVALGLAAGASVIRAETTAINRAHFSVADNDGACPMDERFAPAGPDARSATWDAGAVVVEILDEGIPARVSHDAGTHCCNLALFTCTEIIERLGLHAPCGFLHLPYLPEQVAWLIRQDRTPPSGEPPSMSLDTQIRAVRAGLAVLARQAAGAS